MKRLVLIIVFLCMILSGCSTREIKEASDIFNVSTSYFDHFSCSTAEGTYSVQGTVYQMEQDNNAVLTSVSGKDQSLLTVTGKMKCVEGEIQLVYTAPDGTQTIIADYDDETLDTSVRLSDGTGTIHFKGNGEKAVYDFNLIMKTEDNIVFDHGFSTESDIDSSIPEIPEPVTDIIEDHWPVSISKITEGLSASPLSFEIPIDHPMTLSISCVTESGTMRMKIKDINGETYFDEKDMQTSSFHVDIKEEGIYTVYIWAKYHVGSFTIKPSP